jgi:hypothetical protein
MITQTAIPPTNLDPGEVIRDYSGNCYSYVGYFINYVPPSGYIVVNENRFTATTATTYVDCAECLQVEPLVGTFNEWIGNGAYSVNCPGCQLTNFGVQTIFYTHPSVNQIQTGVTIYNNSSLSFPVTVDYIRYGNKIYSVDNSGVITEFCTVNGVC